MDCSTPGLLIHHQLLEFTQTHVHQVSDPIQPSHPLSSPTPPTFDLSQHQGLQMSQFFIPGGQSIGVSALASVLPVNIGLISFRMDWLGLLDVQGTLKSLLQHHTVAYQCLSLNLNQKTSNFQGNGMRARMQIIYWCPNKDSAGLLMQMQLEIP